jgi:hypothetical protein
MKMFQYVVVATPSAVEKSLQYQVVKATKIEKSLEYKMKMTPNVTTQAVDNIEKTTAMGHGTIVS